MPHHAFGFESAAARAPRGPNLWPTGSCFSASSVNLTMPVEHRRSKFLNNGLERDHGHLKQRLYPMRGFKRGTSADTVVRGHALIRNLRQGFSTLTAAVPLYLRLSTAWQQLAQAI